MYQQPPQWGPGYQQPQQGYGYAPAPMMQPGCRMCGYQGRMAYASKASGFAWFAFVILLIVFFPVCWVPLVLFKKHAQKCPQCHNVHGNWA